MEIINPDTNKIVNLYEPMEAPEGKLALWDGNEIDAFAKGEGYCAPEAADKELFISNAFFLMANHELILNDSRMFLSPIGIQSGLAYTGTSFFKNPTLGIYIEWWLNFAKCGIRMENCTPHLVYYISGSPLSGGNSCGMVNPEGDSRPAFLPNFALAWSSFARINSRYTAAKNQYEAWSLRQVVDTLNSSPAKKPKELAINRMLVGEIRRLNEKVDHLQVYIKNLHDDMEDAHTIRCYDRIAPLYTEMQGKIASIDHEIDFWRKMHRCEKERLHSGEISAKTAQRKITEILAKKENLNNRKKQIMAQYAEQLKKIDTHITLSSVRRIFEDANK